MVGLSAAGVLTVIGRSALNVGSGHIVSIGDGFAEIDIHTWNQIRQSARPVNLA
ncbi:hypothetical protein [Lentzea guizhouensis]|uniref:hypothetical protein n=1 Tax=Lentzea guizhouensis TaxID=1586287 RepID=UPI0012B69076|nr:hypothetical protein [Lentzea guizhouensis]